MGTTTINLSDAAIAYGGPRSSGPNLVSRAYVQFPSSTYSSLDLDVTGAETFTINVLQDNTSGTYYSIDGGTEVSPTIASSNTTWQPLVVTLPDTGTHRVTIKNRTSNTYLDSTNGITLSAASGTPTYSRPVGFGAMVTLTPGGSTYVHDEGGWDSYPVGSYSGSLYGQWPFVSIRLRFTGPLRVWQYVGGGTLVARIDGVDQSELTIPSEARNRWLTVYTPGDSSEHEAIITYTSTTSQNVYQVAASTISTTTLTRRETLMAYGDSKTALTGPSTGRLGYQYLVGKARNLAICSRGIGFTTMAVAANAGPSVWTTPVTVDAGANTTTNRSNGHPRAWDVTRENPKWVACWYGANDMADNWYTANTANGHEQPSDLETAYGSLLTYLKGSGVMAALSRFVAIALEPRSDVTDGTRATWNTAISNAVTAASDSRFVYQATETLDRGTIHPGDAPHAQLANLLIPHYGTGYTLALSASTALTADTITATVTLPGGATFVSGYTITIAWGDGNTSPVTFTAGQTSGTATHQYASAGTYGPVGTNSQGWTDPAAESVTITALATSAPTIGFGIGSGLLCAS